MRFSQFLIMIYLLPFAISATPLELLLNIVFISGTRWNQEMQNHIKLKQIECPEILKKYPKNNSLNRGFYSFLAAIYSRPLCLEKTLIQ